MASFFHAARNGRLFAGLIAGAMNALAGGGSFVSLPALIAAGVPSVQANASSTVALFPGGAASVWAYRDGLSPVGPASLRALLIATLAGGAIGGLLLLSKPSQAFDVILPWLLLMASVTLAFGRRAGEWLRKRCKIAPVAATAAKVRRDTIMVSPSNKFRALEVEWRSPTLCASGLGLRRTTQIQACRFLRRCRGSDSPLAIQTSVGITSLHVRGSTEIVPEQDENPSIRRGRREHYVSQSVERVACCEIEVSSR